MNDIKPPQKTQPKTAPKAQVQATQPPAAKVGPQPAVAEVSSQPVSRPRKRWRLGILLLILAITVVAAWFYRAQILRNLPF